MQQREGHVDPNFPEHVCKLLKSLYDLKQAAQLWNQLLSKTLKKHGFKQVLTDTSCFVAIDQDGTSIIMAVFVDDLLIAAKTPKLIKHTIQSLKQHFHVKELGPAKWILGIAILRDMDADITTMHQSK